MSDNRDMGVEFGDLTEDLESESYPMTMEQVLDKYGDRELEHSNGTVTLREVIQPEENREFEGADEVHQTVLNMIGDEAVGREGQSGRGAGTATNEGDPESL